MVLVSCAPAQTCKDGSDLCPTSYGSSYGSSGTCKDGLDLCPKPKPSPKPSPKPMSTCDGTDLCDANGASLTMKATTAATTAAPKAACVAGGKCAVSGTLLMTITGHVVEAENVVKDVLASSLQVKKSDIIKAVLIPIASSRRLASAPAPAPKTSTQASAKASGSVYRLEYEVQVPEGKSHADVLDKAAQLPNKLPQEFKTYGVQVTGVTHSSFPVSFDNSATTTAGAFQLAQEEAANRVAGDDNAFLQIIPRVILIGGPCFIGYLATVPGCKEICARGNK